MLLAFLLSFAFIRTSARLARSPRVTWWPGSVDVGGTHVHHLVWGIWLLLLAGFAAFVSDLYSPWWQITAVAFGIGAGLTLDEFALWLHLEDVYWSTEGRQSIDAVIVAAVVAGLVVLGVQPFDVGDAGWGIATVAGAVLILLLALITCAKGRLLLAVVAVFVPVVGLVCAVRLATPSSPWARRFYRGRRADRMARARERHGHEARLTHLSQSLRNAIGGAPDRE